MFCRICGRLMEVKKDWNGCVIASRCPKDCKPKTERTKIGRYSGQSKSEHKFGDYK